MASIEDGMMAILSVSKSAETQARTAKEGMLSMIESRKDLWRRLPPEKRAAWMQACPDPVSAQLLALYHELKEMFE